jgi:pimeloyl-ACP methyl ester carboxylesterase
VLRKLVITLLVLFMTASIAVWILFERADVENSVMDASARSTAPGLFVELSDGVTRYEIGGPEEGQVVLLIHGFSVPSYIWDTTFAALSDSGFKVVRFDAFGRGYSDRPDVDYNGDLFERQVIELLDALELSEPADLVGLSMGGAVSARVAANNSERIRRLVFVDPTTRAWQAPGMPELIGEIYFRINNVPGMAEGQLTDFLYPENYPDWVGRYREQMRYMGFGRAISSTIYHFGPEDHFANFARLAEHDFPIMLIWGKQDRVLDISGAAALQEILDLEFLPVDEAGHLPHIEQSGVVNPAIAEFLGTDPEEAGGAHENPER